MREDKRVTNRVYELSFMFLKKECFQNTLKGLEASRKNGKVDKNEVRNMLESFNKTHEESKIESYPWVQYDTKFNLASDQGYFIKSYIRRARFSEKRLTRLISNEPQALEDIDSYYLGKIFKECSIFFEESWFLRPYIHFSEWHLEFQAGMSSEMKLLWKNQMEPTIEIAGEEFYVLTEMDVLGLIESDMYSLNDDFTHPSPFANEQAKIYKEGLKRAHEGELVVLARYFD
jgi:hypothetical protein